MGVDIVFEYAAATPDDEAGRITGWLPGELSVAGRNQARDLGERHRGGGLAAVLCSDLARAVETVEIAFAGFRIPIHRDTRLRDCDYGRLTGRPVTELVEHDRRLPYQPFPDGQSYRQVIGQARRFLRDVAAAWDGRQILIVAHRANRVAVEHLLTGRELTGLLDREPAGSPADPPASTAVWSYQLSTSWPDRDGMCAAHCWCRSGACAPGPSAATGSPAN